MRRNNVLPEERPQWQQMQYKQQWTLYGPLRDPNVEGRNEMTLK